MSDLKLFSEIIVLYENDHLLVLNKPSGLIVHPARPAGGGDGSLPADLPARIAQAGAPACAASTADRSAQAGTTEQTLVDWLLSRYPNIASVGEATALPDGNIIKRPGIVHRLDKETSGILLVAKTNEAFAHLKKQFQERRIKKTYRAFVYGTVAQDRGVIDRPIGKSKSDPRLWSAQRGARGIMRDAVTEYTVLSRLPAPACLPAQAGAGRQAGGTDASYLEVSPKTGRTHQIRAHLKAVNHPVVCDRLYAPKREPILGFTRLALHALRLMFTDTDGTERTIEAPLPEDFLRAEKELKNALK